MPCERQIDFYIPYPVQQVFERMSKELFIGGFHVDFVDPTHYQILASTDLSMASWGEYITISFFDPQNGGARIIVQSKPKLPTVLVDFGRNQNNVTAVMNHFMYLYPPKQ